MRDVRKKTVVSESQSRFVQYPDSQLLYYEPDMKDEEELMKLAHVYLITVRRQDLKHSLSSGEAPR